MSTFLLQKESMIKAPLAEVWNFFSDPGNLSRITPAYMKFKVIDCPDVDEIFEGMLIKYKVSPVLGIPLNWTTKITEVKTMHRFTDTQLKGPYALWEHTHTFRAKGDSVHMLDQVRYAMPFGPLGKLAHVIFVKKQLEGIFSHRESVIETLFGPAKKP